MVPKIILCTVLTILTAKADYVSYKDYKVFDVIPKSDEDVRLINELKFSDRYLDYFVWSEVVSINNKVKIMVEPNKRKDLHDYLTKVGLKSDLVIDNVQSLIDQQISRPEIFSSSSEYNWQYYQNMEEIDEWIDKIALQYSDVATLITAGSSVQGYPIRGIKIDYKKRSNPTIGMIEGGLHAREWISPATVTWIINEFLTSTNAEIRGLAENVVWHIFPVVNPDGYKYSFTDNRMWRKNRNTENFRNCTQWGLSNDMSNGIDLNRNFGFLWNGIGASQNPCAETYAGPAAFSEAESRAIANYLFGLQNEGNVVYYFTLHSYSQMILVPYSHVGGEDVLEVPHYGDMFEMSIRGASKLEKRHNTSYTVGTSLDILYPVTGSSFDWVKGVAKVPIVLLYELRDTGEFGFLLPPQQIIPNNEEVMDSLVEIDRVSRALNYYHSSAYKFSISTSLIILMILSIVV